jgi:hypothetical protein
VFRAVLTTRHLSGPGSQAEGSMANRAAPSLGLLAPAAEQSRVELEVAQRRRLETGHQQSIPH